MDTSTARGGTGKPIFEAVVKPHRSLSRRGMVLTIGAMLTGSALITSMMARLGAWPVLGFNGADICLAIFLMWLNARAARAMEIITLCETTLAVTSTDVHGRSQKISLAPYWLQVVLQERAGTVPKLLLTTSGRTKEIARQLGEAEKRDLAAALSRALERWRNPRFDNAQLR